MRLARPRELARVAGAARFDWVWTGSEIQMIELHDDRLLTLEDTVEFFNLVLQTKLTAPEKTDLVAFMRAL